MISNKNINFSDFLKNEFNLNFFKQNKKEDIIVDIDDIFRIEKNKKEIVKKIQKHNKLEDILDKKLKDESKEDVDKKIQENWNQVFERIRYELLNAERSLKEDSDKTITKKNKKVFKFQNYNLITNKDSESLVYAWFGGFVVVTTVFFMFFISLNLVQIKDYENIALQNNENQVQVYRKASISQEARSEYIKTNNQKFEKLGANQTKKIKLDDSSGQVAGVIEQNKILEKENNKSFYQEILDLFVNLF